MTADLRMVEAETQPGPPGSAALEDCFYYFRSQIDSPSTEGIFRTDYSAEGAGLIQVHFSTLAAFVAWARYLGFDIQQEPKARRLFRSAIGTVRFRGRDYAIALCHVQFSDSGALS